MVTYTVALDLNDDGAFTGPSEDITASVLRLEWRLGFAHPFDSVAAPSSARLALRNPDRAFSPGVSARDLSPGRPLRIQSHEAGVTRTHFTGAIDRVEPQPGALSERAAVIHARAVDSDLARAAVRPGLFAQVTADQVIAAVLESAPVRRPLLEGHLIIGLPGRSTIGTHRLFGPALTPSLETGISRLAYVAADESAAFALGIIRAVCDGERGRFFINRDGQPVFHNRHHALRQTTPVAAFTDTMDGLDYLYGADLVNTVRVRLTPRAPGQPASTLWQLTGSICLEAGQTRRLVARFTGSDRRPTAALIVLPPLPYTDYAAASSASGAGPDRTGSVAAALVAVGACSAVIEYRNLSASAVYLTSGARLRGTPFTSADPVHIEQTDAASITFYGPAALDFDLVALLSPDEADQFARYELARRSLPRGLIRSVHLSAPAHRSQILARTLFDRVTLSESQTGHTADYCIIAEAHEVDLGGHRHRVTWLLEPVPSDVYFLVGHHRPDGSRVLAF